MNTSSTTESRHHRLRDTYRRQIGELGVFVEGTLSSVQRPGQKKTAWQLTYKQAGKTRTVYVPLALVPEVQQWTKEFKRLKQLIRKVTNQNLAIIRRHVTVRRAENRALRPMRNSAGGNSSVASCRRTC